MDMITTERINSHSPKHRFYQQALTCEGHSLGWEANITYKSHCTTINRDNVVVNHCQSEHNICPCMVRMSDYWECVNFYAINRVITLIILHLFLRLLVCFPMME